MKADTRGTPYCIAPETLKEEPLGCPVDMWACGAVFYFMLVRNGLEVCRFDTLSVGQQSRCTLILS